MQQEYVLVEGQKVPRYLRQAVVFANNQLIEIGDNELAYFDTRTYRRLVWRKRLVRVVVFAAVVALWGPTIFSWTKDIGLVLLLPLIVLVILNFLVGVGGGETLLNLIASRIFGIPAVPEWYIERAVRNGLVELRTVRVVVPDGAEGPSEAELQANFEANCEYDY